jgi:hypothetical protein
VVDPRLKPMVTLFKLSYLCQQAKAPRAAAAMGHRNEEPFLKAFFKECNKTIAEGSVDNAYSFSSLNPVALYRVGMMRKVGSKFAKASLDAITFIHDKDGDLVMIPTEVKSRVSNATISEASERLEDMLGVEQFSSKCQPFICRWLVPGSNP